MSHSLFRFTLSSILLAGCSIAWGQGSPDRATMNAEDRINGVTSGGYLSLDEDDRPLNAAGAYPMSTIDRLNAARRSTSLAGSPQPNSGADPHRCDDSRRHGDHAKPEGTARRLALSLA